jgi:hypothetical protein
MKVIITKYAVSSGVEVVEGEVNENLPELLKVGYGYYHGKGREWHTTSETAKVKVKEMFAKKRKSLQKQLDSLDDRLQKVLSQIPEKLS